MKFCYTIAHSFPKLFLLRGILAASWVILATSLLNGCADPTAGGNSPYVVVDAVSVARALGRDEVIQQKLEDASKLLNDQLTQIGTTLQEQLKEEQDKLAPSKNQSAQKKINDLTAQTQLKLRQSQLLAQQQAEQYRAKLLQEFREEILAVAIDIAKKRHVLSVQITNSDLLWYDPSIDITADVIKVLRASENKHEITEKDAKFETPPPSESKTPEESAQKSAQVKELNQLMDNIADEDKPESQE